MKTITTKEECEQLDPELARFVDEWHLSTTPRTMEATFKLRLDRASLEVDLMNTSLDNETHNIDSIELMGFPYDLVLATPAPLANLSDKDRDLSIPLVNARDFKREKLRYWATPLIFANGAQVKAKEIKKYQLEYVYAPQECGFDTYCSGSDRHFKRWDCIQTPALLLEDQRISRIEEQSYNSDKRDKKQHRLKLEQINFIKQALNNKDYDYLYTMHRRAMTANLFSLASHSSMFPSNRGRLTKDQMSGINRYRGYKIRSDAQVESYRVQLYEKVFDDDKISNKLLVQAASGSRYDTSVKLVEMFKPTALTVFL